MGRMKRFGSGVSALGAACATLLAMTVLVTCENGIDLKGALEVEVMKSNDKYLEVTHIDLGTETQVSPTGIIGVYFDRAIDPATVTPNTIVFRDGEGNAVDYPGKGVECVASAFLVRIRVYPYLAANTDFTLMVAGVRGSDGSVIHDVQTRHFRTKNILTGSIVGIASKNATSAAGYTDSPIVDVACKVSDQFTQIQYKIALDYETSDSPVWYDPRVTVTSPAGGNFTIENLDLSAIKPEAYGQGPLRLTVLFRGKNPGTEDYVDGVADTAPIFVDTAKPLGGSLSINGGAAWSPLSAVDVAVSGMDDGTISSGLAAVSLSNDGTSWSGFEPLGNAASWNLVTGEGGLADRGQRTVYARVRDGAGNVSDAITGVIGFDDAKPAAGTWLINGGALTAYQGSVTVQAASLPSDGESGVSEMRFSNDNAAWSDWEAVANSKGWNLLSDAGGTAGDGTKSVYVQIRDLAGNVSDAASDGIYYTSTLPSISAPDLAALHDSGASNSDNVTNKATNLTFTVTAEAGISIELKDNTTSSVYSGAVSGTTWTFSGINLGEGTHELIAQTNAGDYFSSDPITVTIDTTPPVAPVMGTNATVNTRLPAWSWASGGGGSGLFRYTCDALGATNAETSNVSVSATASLADGSYGLSVTELDAAGNVSASGTQTITVNAPPNAPSVTAEETVTLATSMKWSWTSNGFGSGVYRYQLDSVSDTGWTTTSYASVTLSGLSDTTHYLYVEERDAGGEWSSYGSRSVRVTPVIPYNGQTRVSTTPTLEWRAAGVATVSYTLYAQNPKTSLFEEVATVTGTSYKITMPLPTQTTINWKLTANSKLGTTNIPSKGYFSFTTNLR